MSIKLLVADDSITIQKVIGIIFGGDEYSLTVVDNGKAAVEKARDICPDVMLIDALMPGMTGYEVSEAVRALPELADKPILILTGSFEPFDEDKARKCGADDFMAKPFESQQIVNKVKELAELGASRARSAATAQPPAASQTPLEAPPAVTPMAAVETGPVSVPPPASAATPPIDDIWGAFTTEPEPPAVLPELSTSHVSTEAVVRADVFEMVNEESISHTVATEPPAAVPQSDHTGSQWVPVEENTFEFVEETVSELPATVLSPPVEEASFGDIAFEDDAATPYTAAAAAVIETPTTVPAPEQAFGSFAEQMVSFDEPAPAEAQHVPAAVHASPDDALILHTEEQLPSFVEPVSMFDAGAVATLPETPAPAHDPIVPLSTAMDASTSIVVPPAAVTSTEAPLLTEEQLKAAISAVSKEVIERIVWEVVPDLAEELIKEAIRRIKEGL